MELQPPAKVSAIPEKALYGLWEAIQDMDRYIENYRANARREGLVAEDGVMLDGTSTLLKAYEIRATLLVAYARLV